MAGSGCEVCGHDRAQHAGTGCATCRYEEAAGRRPLARVCGGATRPTRSGPAEQVSAPRLAQNRVWLARTYRMTFACAAVALAGLVWLPEDGAEGPRAVAIAAALVATSGALVIGVHALVQLAGMAMNHLARVKKASGGT